MQLCYAVSREPFPVNTQIIDKGTPEELYHNPKLPLIASFFGEYNVIDSKIYYAHQLKIVKKSPLKAIVKRSYFNGDSWLVEAKHNSKSIFIEHFSKVEANREIYFGIKA